MAQSLKKENVNKTYTPKQKLWARQLIYGNHADFSEKILKIYDINGNLIPFKKNRAQIEFGKVWDECVRRFGYVRIITVKARKRGISTEVAGRFVHGMTKAETRGQMCDSLVIAHHDDSSTALFGITKKMINNMGDFTPPLTSMSMHRFDTKLSAYTCMTAGKQAEEGAGKGRGMTPRQVHISEVAHIHNSHNLATSVISAVPCVPGTAVVMESTANGPGDYFYTQFVAAVKGETDFLPFFAPWFWDDDNQSDVPDDFVLTDDDKEYQARHGLSMRQMAWRRKMEITQGLTPEHGRMKFKRENPATWEEAFISSALNSYISGDDIRDAFEREPKTQGPDTAVIAAYDPANKGSEMGKDRDAFVIRHGSHIFGLELPVFNEDDFDARVNFLQSKLDNKVLGIDKLFLDAGGGGYQLKSRLKSLGYGSRVQYVEFGAAADDQLKANLKRDEMYVDFNDLLTDKHDPLSIKVEEKYRDAVIADLTAAGFKHDHKNRPKIESKEDIKKKLKMSTDIADAFIMLVAAKVKKRTLINKNSTADLDFNYYEV